MVDGGLPAHDDPIDGNGLAREDAQGITDLHFQRVEYALLFAHDHPCGARSQVDQALDSRTGALDGELFEKSADLHDEGDLACREVLAYDDGGDERDRHQDVGLYVELGDKSDYRPDHDRHAAQDDGHPRGVYGEDVGGEEAQDEGQPRDNEERDGLLYSACIHDLLDALCCRI